MRKGTPGVLYVGIQGGLMEISHHVYRNILSRFRYCKMRAGNIHDVAGSYSVGILPRGRSDCGVSLFMPIGFCIWKNYTPLVVLVEIRDTSDLVVDNLFQHYTAIVYLPFVDSGARQKMDEHID